MWPLAYNLIQISQFGELHKAVTAKFRSFTMEYLIFNISVRTQASTMTWQNKQQTFQNMLYLYSSLTAEQANWDTRILFSLVHKTIAKIFWFYILNYWKSKQMYTKMQHEYWSVVSGYSNFFLVFWKSNINITQWPLN